MQTNGLPNGYARFRVSDISYGTKFTFVAKSKKQAWSKYVSTYFRNSPLKPNPSDYSIEEIDKVHA